MSNVEAVPIYSAEGRKSPGEKIKAIIGKIKEFGRRIQEKLGLKGKELTEATDEALIFNAEETIAAADEDGVRTEEEQAEVQEAVSSVVVEGVMEEAGMIEAADKNPIILLDKKETAPDLVISLQSFRDSGETLPNGQRISDLASEILRREEATAMELAELEEVERELANETATQTTSETYEKTPNVAFAELIKDIRSKEYDRSGETLYRPRAEIICDRDHIENQRIDVINHIDRDTTELNFKLRSTPTFESGQTSSGEKVEPGFIAFENIAHSQEYSLCGASTFEKDHVKVSIANDGEVRAARGLVKIEAPNDVPPDELEKIISGIMDDLGVPDGLSEVSGESERNYKTARYAWQHKINGELSAEQAEAAEKLTRREVFSGYTTLVEEGKHKEYLEKYGADIRPVHHLGTGSASSIYRMLTVGGMCSSERYRRGAIKSGMSSAEDFRTGGADSFFTRLNTREQVESSIWGSDTVVSFKPSLLDRTDWYSYNNDKYGSTDENIFATRLSPDEMLQAVKDKRALCNNEQMFRMGIGPQYVESITVTAERRPQLIEELKNMGLTEFDGRPIEDVIIGVGGDEPSANSNYNSVWDNNLDGFDSWSSTGQSSASDLFKDWYKDFV